MRIEGKIFLKFQIEDSGFENEDTKFRYCSVILNVKKLKILDELKFLEHKNFIMADFFLIENKNKENKASKLIYIKAKI